MNIYNLKKIHTFKNTKMHIWEFEKFFSLVPLITLGKTTYDFSPSLHICFILGFAEASNILSSLQFFWIIN